MDILGLKKHFHTTSSGDHFLTKKKWRLILIIILNLVILVAATTSVTERVKYYEALDFMNQENYEQAISLFQSLGTYKDSSELSTQCYQLLEEKYKDLNLYKEDILSSIFDKLIPQLESLGIDGDCVIDSISYAYTHCEICDNHDFEMDGILSFTAGDYDFKIPLYCNGTLDSPVYSLETGKISKSHHEDRVLQETELFSGKKQ